MNSKEQPQKDLEINNDQTASEPSRIEDTDAQFASITQTPPTGRLSVTILAGRKLNVSNYQAKPYCVVEFERNEFVTREAIREGDLSAHRDGKQMNFMDL